ncbi:hypothetical protein D3C87_1093040 [compost metagenome]
MHDTRDAEAPPVARPGFCARLALVPRAGGAHAFEALDQAAGVGRLSSETCIPRDHGIAQPKIERVHPELVSEFVHL